MSFFEFPHARTYDSDLGWIIAQMKDNIDAIKWLQRYAESHQPEYEELKEKVDALVNNLVDVIEPWDSSIEYPIYSIVSYQGQNYIAIRPVPVGAMITNEYYWQPANTVFQQINAIGATVSDLQDDMESAQLNEGGTSFLSAYIVPGKGFIYDMKLQGQLHHFRRAHEAQSGYDANSVRQLVEEETPDPYGYTGMINCALTGPYMFDGEYEGTWPSNEALYYMGINDQNEVTLLPLFNGDPSEAEIRAAGNNGGCIWGYIVKDGAVYQPTSQELTWPVGGAAGHTYGPDIWLARSPRSNLAFDADGGMHFIMASARRVGSVGFTCPELAQWMVDHGIVEAYSMDGGGNSNLFSGKMRVGTSQTPVRRVAYTYLYVE